MKSYNISLYKLFMFVACCAATSIATANTVAIGWHSFDGDTATETASEAATGVSGTIVGGVSEVTGSNLDNQTYGDGASFTAAADSTGITANTYNNNNKRVDITVTNGTGSDLSIDAIALDAQLIFGSGSVTVSHLSGQSVLADGITGRLLDTLTIADSVYTAVQQSVSTSAMDDVVLADGETAAFRIEVVAGEGVAALAVKLDNIAVMTSTDLNPQPPVVADTVAIGWHSFDGDIATETASEAATGVSGTIIGGLEEGVANNIESATYGSGASFTAVTDSTGIKGTTNNNDQKRIDITVTNNTSGELALDYIDFDAAAAGNLNGVVTVTHLSGSSALADGYTGRELGSLVLDSWGTKETSIATAAMDDVVLAVGETAAFRLEISSSAGGWTAVKLDNIAVMTSTDLSAEAPAADTVAIGWHSFDGDTATETASEAATGVSGTIIGGVSEVTGSNLDNQTYGDGASFTAAADSTGITANTYNNNNKRVDITVTNGTGSDLSIDAIALDAQLIFGSGSVTVSHLSGSSALVDSFTGRLLDTLTIADYTAVQQTVVTSAMDDVVLADGESAAFRIEVVAGEGVAALAVKLDNIAVMTSTEFAAPALETVAIGWHSFDGDTATETASYASVGVTGTIVGGVEEIVGSNLDNQTYGDGATFTPAVASTGITANTYSNDNKRVDITVTNGTGSDLSIGAIALDANLIFGSGSVTVSHLSGSSALADGFTGRLLDTLTIDGYTPVQQTVSTSAMDDVVLADGESAAFRIEVVAGEGVAALAVKLDNIAVMTATELEEPPFDDDAVVLAAWADFALTGSSLSSQAPSYTTVGVTANLGKDVNPAVSAQGGGQKAEANDGTDSSYGSAYSISAANMDTDNPSALRINNWGNANNQYIDFSITNTTGSDLRLTGIHFDAQTIYSNNHVVVDGVVTSEGTPHSVTVSHFDAVSDLIDGDVTQRTLGTGTSTMNFVPKGNGISLAAMADTILAEGETAAFRLRITNADGAKGHMRIDNLAITGIPAGTIRTLTVDTSAVEAGAGGVDLNGSRKYVDGETVSITATAAEGYTFTGWSGASDSTDATISVTLSADTTLTPNFAAAPTELPTLSISSDGTNVTLTWEGTATLKRADSLSGGFSEVTGATSPHTEAVSGEKFYRLEQ